jgi:hypothetical protein
LRERSTCFGQIRDQPPEFLILECSGQLLCVRRDKAKAESPAQSEGEKFAQGWRV